jgi:hydroxyacylglutathione hydrolase
MTIKKIISGPLGNNTIIVHDDKDAVVIDPSIDSFGLIDKYIVKHKLIVKAIFLTHSHFDHIADVAILKQKTKANIYIHPEDADNLINPGVDKISCMFPVKGSNPDVLIHDNQEIIIGNLKFIVIYTPGHSPGSVCYYLPDNNTLFAGDTLFKGSIGNISFPTSRPALMWGSLKKLAKLPKNTKVIPGHGEDTSIGKESWLDRAEEFFS